MVGFGTPPLGISRKPTFKTSAEGMNSAWRLWKISVQKESASAWRNGGLPCHAKKKNEKLWNSIVFVCICEIMLDQRTSNSKFEAPFDGWCWSHREQPCPPGRAPCTSWTRFFFRRRCTMVSRMPPMCGAGSGTMGIKLPIRYTWCTLIYSTIWLWWINIYKYNFQGMDIHLPAIISYFDVHRMTVWTSRPIPAFVGWTTAYSTWFDRTHISQSLQRMQCIMDILNNTCGFRYIKPQGVSAVIVANVSFVLAIICSPWLRWMIW